jgi:hypothetical protein
MMKSILTALFVILIMDTAQAHVRQWTVKESLSNGDVLIKVIAEDLSLRDVQDQISQQVVSKQIFSREQIPEVRLDADFGPLMLPKKGKPLWVPVKSAWSSQDEDNYSVWFATQVETNFLHDTRLLADCADLGFLFRWVYARNNSLPMANTLHGGKLFGHFSSSAEWDKLKQDPDWRKDERFKAAMEYLFDQTDTRTLASDLAPVEVDLRYIRPSVIFMLMAASRHTQTIKSIDLQDGITTLSANLPASEEIFRSPWIVAAEVQQFFGIWRSTVETQLGGQTKWQLTPADQMPGFSLELFNLHLTDPSQIPELWINQKLGIAISDVRRLTVKVISFINQLTMRKHVVTEGVFFCFLKACSPSSQTYDDYSTPSRDHRLAALQTDILSLIQVIDPQDVQKALAPLDKNNEFVFGTGLTPYKLILDPAAMAKLNSDPRVSFVERWGVQGIANADRADFYSNAQILQNLIYERNGKIYFSPTTFDSSELDSRIRLVFKNFDSFIKDPKSPVDAVSAVKNHLNKLVLGSTGPKCSGGQTCHYSDVIWINGTGDRISQWSSKAGDPLQARWGMTHFQ